MGTIGLPKIEINFKANAASAISRSANGVACLIVFDDTDNTFDFVEYKSIEDVETTKFTTENLNAIKDCLLGQPGKLIVCRVDTLQTISDAVALLENKSFNWVGAIVATAAEQQDLVTWVISQNVFRTKKIKSIAYKATVTDNMHISNFVNTKVKRVLDSAEIDGHLYLGRLVGLFAGLGMDKSATYYKLTDLEYVVEPADVETEVNSGNLVLFNDEEEVRIARAVNTLQTLGTDLTDDMKKITIVEAMDLMFEDIHNSFKNDYLGKYKNKYDNQVLFISAVNTYFRELAKEDILDDAYNNQANIDVEAQRVAWVSSGKIEAAAWDEQTVKNNSFRSNLYLAGNVKILDAMEDFTFNIQMM